MQSSRHMVSPLVFIAAVIITTISGVAIARGNIVVHADSISNPRSKTQNTIMQSETVSDQPAINTENQNNDTAVSNDMHSSMQSNNSAQSYSSVTVDGTVHSVTNDGELHETYTSPANDSAGTTRIDISVQSNTDGSGYSSSNTSMYNNSSTYNSSNLYQRNTP